MPKRTKNKKQIDKFVGWLSGKQLVWLWMHTHTHTDTTTHKETHTLWQQEENNLEIFVKNHIKYSNKIIKMWKSRAILI